MPRDNSPRRKPRQVRAELTRDRILTAAAHIFTEHGYAAGTTNRIAERARVSIGSVYQYFPNKESILAALLVDHIERDAAAALDLDGLPLPEALRLFARRTIDNHQHDPRLLRMMIEEAPIDADFIGKVLAYEQERVAQVRALLAGHPQIRVDDLDTAALMIVNTVEMLPHKLLATRQLDPRRLEDELVTMLTRYLTASDQTAG
ncbi:TetR/AcrR family transcriptional regulator [Actinoplanes sp. NBRC 101535]|uniref:TetR/AcrR family transcriptional regulator n=1 Tax=Actinoplanes sp. NBRC 101535 TaxID=3032196 RepID=UPI0024A117A0|nr:TetR/AcrR family transcriptional regulator [Actinoplanes sp. NBRC 101535]GLY04058.1 putative transcriptional regulator, TetR family protein [Actinoplanes sp. NBRC 101535]